MKRLALAACAALFAASLAPGFAQSANTSSAAKPSCAAGDPVVWENTASKTKAYHASGDKYYGNTKQGKYVCESQAKSDGYHEAKSSGKASPSAGASPKPAAPSPAPSATPGSKHHHHKAAASPAPSPEAT